MIDKSALSQFHPTSSGKPYDIMEEAKPLFDLLDHGAPFLKSGLDDTSIVLLATGLIEKFLRLSLISLFKSNMVSKTMLADVFEGKGALATFSAKIEVCAGLGNISPDVRHDLKIVNRIRNQFAHSPYQRHLKEFDSCLTLRLKSKQVIQDDCKEREMFKQSCLGIIGHLGLGTLWMVAAGRFLSSNKEGVQREYELMIQSTERDQTAT